MLWSNKPSGVSVTIENKVWEKLNGFARKWKAEQNNKYQSEGDLVSELLIKHNRKEIELTPFKMEAKKAKLLNLDQEATKIYKELPIGTRAYTINGLLRTWLKNNKIKSN